MSAVQAVVWGLRCDRCGFSDYQAPKVSAARHLARLDGWTQQKPTPEATKTRVDFCPECTDDRRFGQVLTEPQEGQQ